MNSVTIAAVGDVATGFDPPEKSFEHVLEPLRSADLRFAQVERLYTERGIRQAHAIGGVNAKQHPSKAAIFKTVPFDVLSIASNVTGYFGPEGAEDTAETFRLLGIPTVGAGRNIAEARRPAVITHGGLRFAFLGYATVLLPQYWATDDRAGAAPMRAHTFYEPYEFQPGAPARVVTTPHQRDLDNLLEDIARAKQLADFVLVSLHWGVHFVPRPCDYQITVAHAAIDAGASAILGHHPHQQQGIEIYRNGAIFYSIGNFSVHRASGAQGHSYCMPNGEYQFKDIYTVEPDPGYVFEYKRHYNEGGIVFIDFDSMGISRTSYLPTLLNQAGQPEIVRTDHPQFEKSRTYLGWAGKFIAGGVTQLKAVDGRYEVFVRNSS